MRIFSHRAMARRAKFCAVWVIKERLFELCPSTAVLKHVVKLHPPTDAFGKGIALSHFDLLPSFDQH